MNGIRLLGRCQLHRLVLPGLPPHPVLLHARAFSVKETVQSVLQTEAGWFRSLSESKAVAASQQWLEFVHDSTGLPWWGSIMISTIILRAVVTLPIVVYQAKILARVENIQLELKELVPELKKETAYAMKKFQWTQQQAMVVYKRSLKKQWQKLIVRDNCHPMKAGILVLVQLPLWICMSMSLRNMAFMMPSQDTAAQLLYLTLTVGGFGLMPNLAVPDPSLTMPLMLGIANLAIVECQVMLHDHKKPPSKVKRWTTHFHRGLSVLMVPIGASVPACMCLYWTTSSVFGLVQNLVFMSPKIRRFLGIPRAESESQNPYRLLQEKIADRFNRFGKAKS